MKLSGLVRIDGSGAGARAGREAVKVAERLVDEQANVSIFALGVGRGVERTELERIIAVCGADKVSGSRIAQCACTVPPLMPVDGSGHRPCTADTLII